MSAIPLLDCLRYALGITRSDCACTNTGMPDDARRSDSGLYLLETEGLMVKAIGSLTDCNEGGLWAMAEWARNEAIQSVVDDILALMQGSSDPVAPPFRGVIGEVKGNQPVVSAYNFHSYLLRCRPLRGGYIRIKKILLLFNDTATFELVLYDNQSNTSLGQWTVTSQAGQKKWFALPTPIDLPLYNNDCEYMRYDFIYLNDGTYSPLNNQVNCGCGGASHYDEYNPQWIKTKDSWSEWVNIAGAKGDDFLERENWTRNLEANGIALDAEIYCDAGKTICNESLNFKADPLAKILAWAFRFRAAQFLTSKLLSMQDPNKFTTAGREQMAMNYETYNTQANARIATIAEEWSRPGMINRYSDCFTCKPTFQKRGIRA